MKTKINKEFKFKWEYWCIGAIFLVLSVAFSGALGFRNKNKLFYNYKVTIIEKGGYAQRNGKFTKVGNYFLIRSVSDTTLYTELNGLNFDPLGQCYGSPLYWKKNIGDTLTFKYIRNNNIMKNFFISWGFFLLIGIPLLSYLY